MLLLFTFTFVERPAQQIYADCFSLNKILNKFHYVLCIYFNITLHYTILPCRVEIVEVNCTAWLSGSFNVNLVNTSCIKWTALLWNWIFLLDCCSRKSLHLCNRLSKDICKIKGRAKVVHVSCRGDNNWIKRRSITFSKRVNIAGGNSVSVDMLFTNTQPCCGYSLKHTDMMLPWY